MHTYRWGYWQADGTERPVENTSASPSAVVPSGLCSDVATSGFKLVQGHISMIERRRTHRFLFEAPIELVPENSHDRIAAITTDIGPNGCFVKTRVFLPTGTLLKLKIVMQGRSFAATGEVLYVLEQQGMGMLFRDVKAKDQAVLDGWLADQNCAPILLRR